MRTDNIMITEDQFKEYIDVQRGGLYNMFAPEARDLTNLTKDQWIYIMENYDMLTTEYLDNEEII